MNTSVPTFTRCLCSRRSNAGGSAPGPPRFIALRTEGQRASRKEKSDTSVPPSRDPDRRSGRSSALPYPPSEQN